MSDCWFPPRWPVEDPDLVQLYTLNTQNGQKVGVCLEEMGVPYEVHVLNIGKGDQFDADYVKHLNPNGKIPSIIDPHGPEDEPVYLMESNVILQYLADKTGRFFPRTYRARLEGMQWMNFQAAHIGPMFGQLGHFFKFAKDKTSDTYAVTRYINETKRLLNVLEQRLQERDYLIGEYSIVDMATISTFNIPGPTLPRSISWQPPQTQPHPHCFRLSNLATLSCPIASGWHR